MTYYQLVLVISAVLAALVTIALRSPDNTVTTTQTTIRVPTPTPDPTHFVPRRPEEIGSANSFVSVARDEPALSVLGDMRVLGTATVGDITVATSSLQLGTFLTSIQQQVASICGNLVCLNGGVNRYLVDCLCDCPPHWLGDACQTHDCYNRGTYNIFTGICNCIGNFNTATMCATQTCSGGHETTADVCPDIGSRSPSPVCNYQGYVDENGRCVCLTAGVVGLYCDQYCASPYINATGCPVRTNWGKDLAPDIPNPTFGVCGGGYTSVVDRIEIVVLSCNNMSLGECQAAWTDESSQCCAPDARCGRGFQQPCGGSDIGCCASITTRNSCLARDCAWCAVPGLCAARDLAQNCTSTTNPIIVTVGDWRRYSYQCTPIIARSQRTICDAAARAEYLGIYQATKCTNITCWDERRAEVMSRIWPSLAAGPLYLAQPVWLQAQHTSGLIPALPKCDAPPTLALSTNMRYFNGLGAPAEWQCTSDAAPNQVMYLIAPEEGFVPSTFEAEGVPLYIFTEYASEIYCLANAPPSRLDSAQIFGSVAAADIQMAYFKKVTFLQPKTYCGAFRFDTIAVGLRLGTLGLSATPYSTYAPFTSWLAIWRPLGLNVTAVPQTIQYDLF